MSFSENIQGALSDYWNRNDVDALDNPEQFSEEVQSIIKTIENVSYNRLPETLSEQEREDFKKSVEEYLNCDHFSERIAGVGSKYRIVYSMIEQSIAVKTKHSWLDWNERLRFLLFRVITAISFAAILLLTGYFAKIWNIPLPLLRIIG